MALGAAATLTIVLVARTRARPARASAPAPSAEPGPPPDSHFVGSQACAGCHAPQHTAWSASHHRHAMEPADARSVRGDFDGATFRYFGRETRFSRSGAAFQVTTENQQGRPETFTVAYTLGYAPLQQYLVAFPDGRLQALPFAWDTRPQYARRPALVPPLPRHQRRPGGSAVLDAAAAELESHVRRLPHHRLQQALLRGGDAPQGRFDSRWSEVGNGCESCHGAGSAHIAAMERRAAPVAGTSDRTSDGCLSSLRARLRQRPARPGGAAR